MKDALPILHQLFDWNLQNDYQGVDVHPMAEERLREALVDAWAVRESKNVDKSVDDEKDKLNNTPV
jgi:hypothetical protein